jgi:hypothetical protein
LARAAPSFISSSPRSILHRGDLFEARPQPSELAPPYRAFLVDAGAALRQHVKLLLLSACRRTRQQLDLDNRCTAEMLDTLSDLRSTQAYGVPFQYRGLVRRHLKIGAFVGSSAGVTVTDLDGNAFYDLTGSYGVNLLGYDCYKGT